MQAVEGRDLWGGVLVQCRPSRLKEGWCETPGCVGRHRDEAAGKMQASASVLTYGAFSDGPGFAN